MSQQVKLRIVNITDVYKLDNFPSLKTLIKQKKEEVANEPGTKVISILTGDFLAPYLLSSLDKGAGMVAMLNATPIDYVIFGNHEDDIEHKYVVQRAKDYKGTWINTNMQDYEAFEQHQKAYDIITLSSPDKSHTRKIGLIGILTNTKALYKKNAFGGATIEDPWDTAEKYKGILEKEHNVDMTIPLSHLYEPQDEVTAKRFDFPLIISGHDHHRVDRVINKSRLVKAGADADYAIVIDIIWKSSDAPKVPEIKVEFFKVADFEPDPVLTKKVQSATSVLTHLQNTHLCPLPSGESLSSAGSRDKLCTMAKFLWSQIRHALNGSDKDEPTVHSVMIDGGDIRGSKDYPPEQKFFSLEDLNSEIQDKLNVAIFEIPGKVLSQGIVDSHQRSNPAYTQIDDAVELDESGHIKTIHGEAFDPEKIYRIGVARYQIGEGGTCTAWIKHFQEHPESVPPPESDRPVRQLLLSFFAENIWRQILQRIDKNKDGKISKSEFKQVDLDNDGRLSREEFAVLMEDIGIQVDLEEVGFIDCLMGVAGDKNNDHFLEYHELQAKMKELSQGK